MYELRDTFVNYQVEFGTGQRVDLLFIYFPDGVFLSTVQETHHTSDFQLFSWLLQHLVKAEEDAKAYKNEVYEKIVKRIMQMK